MLFLVDENLGNFRKLKECIVVPALYAWAAVSYLSFMVFLGPSSTVWHSKFHAFFISMLVRNLSV